jgi:hypothetical protein
VRWVHSTPPDHPTAGRCGRVVQRRVSTSLAPLCFVLVQQLALGARLAFGWGSSPPSRSALAPVESPPGPLTHRPFHRGFLLGTAGFYFVVRCSERFSVTLSHRSPGAMLDGAGPRFRNACTTRSNRQPLGSTYKAVDNMGERRWV